MKGLFITLEGIEGAGKSTIIKKLGDALRKQGVDVVETFEPGDTPAGRRIRQILLDPELKGLSPLTELLLYFADRAEHVKKVIEPALRSGRIVICDRFMDSTFAYQGFGRGLDLKTLYSLNEIATGGLKPDLTVLLDLDAKTGLDRNRKTGKNDRFEQESLEFHEKVRKGFLELARREPERFVVVDATEPIDRVFEEVFIRINEKL